MSSAVASLGGSLISLAARPASLMEETSCSRGAESLCKVCGDKASGKHYGVASCDGCRGFFKRSIRRYARNLDYVCKENGQCVVDVSRRNQCQACRFSKCLQVNMKREAVQHERAPRSASTSMAAIAAAAAAVTASPRKPTAPAALYPTPTAHLYPAPYHPLLYPAAAFFSLRPGLPPSAQSGGSEMLLRQFAPRPEPAASEDEVTSSEEAAAATAATTTAPSSIGCGPLADFCLLPPEQNLYEFAAKLLFLAVKWPRSISSFLQLSYRDQAILLEESWCELFVLTAAQWNFPVDEAHLVPADLPPDRRRLLGDEARRLRDLLTRCALLRIDHSEYACLKAIVLFKGESRGLCESARVTALQEQTVSVLSDRGAGRIGHLLLLLPPARALCRRTLHELLFKPTVGDVAMERLLDDMVNAIRPTSSSSSSSLLHPHR